MKRQNRVAIFNILSTLLLNGIAFLTAPLFAWLLGDSGYGVLSIYSIWTSALAIVFTLQTQGTLVNARTEYDEPTQQRYQSSAMSLSLFVFLGFSALVLVFIRPVSGLLQLEPMLIGLMLVQAFGTFCVNFLNTKFVYEFKAGRNMLMSLAVTLVTLGLSVVLILMQPKETAYIGRILAMASTYGLLGIPACIYILRQGKTFYNREFWKFCILLAIPSVFYNLSDLILGQSDQIMLQRLLSEAHVGRYNFAWRFGNIMFIIFGALNNTWCPFFFEDMKLGQREKLRAKAINFLELFTVLSAGFILLAPEVYGFYAPQDFQDGTNLIPVFTTSYYLNFLCTFPVNFEYYHKKTKVVAVVTILSSLVNIGLNYILIQTMGMMGAAVATMMSHCLQLALHHGYCLWLGKGDYPFGVGVWAKYGIVYLAVVVLVFLTPGAWLLRWGLGACIGAAELLRIRRRKVLI